MAENGNHFPNSPTRPLPFCHSGDFVSGVCNKITRVVILLPWQVRRRTQLDVNQETPELIKIADRRLGLVLADDLKVLGLSRVDTHRLVRDKVLRPIHRGYVFALGTVHLTVEAEILAATVAIAGSWASGATAAEYWGIRRVPRGRVEISLSGNRNPRLAGAKVRRTNLPIIDTVLLTSGGRVSSPRQTLFELAFDLDDRTLRSAYEDCLNRGLCTVEQVREFGSIAVRPGRHGSARFRRVILGRPDDVPFLMSHAELMLADALEGLDPRWVRQHPLPLRNGSTIHLDFARPDLKLGLEVDGELHEDPVKVRADKRRDLLAAEVGWHILRTSTDEIERNLSHVIGLTLAIAQSRSDLLHPTAILV